MNIKYHDSWSCFFTKDIKDELYKIMEEVAKDNPTPSLDSALRFLSLDLHNVIVVILGMDPYPQIGRATGRAFEDGNLSTWSQLKRNASLTNILKLIYANKTNQGVLSISKVRNNLVNNFVITPPNKLFNCWESQGVLLLNVALTCKVGKSGSHLKQWECFTKKCFKYIAEKQPSAQWLLWGKNAQKVAPNNINFLKSKHPRLYKQTSGSFLAENHFSQISEINWSGT